MHIRRLLLSLFLLGPDLGLAEEKGLLTGRVTDESGRALPGVTVELRGAGLPRSVVATTDGAGSYSLAAPAGRFAVSFRLPGFAGLFRDQVRVEGGRSTQLDAVLRLAVSADVVVTSRRTFRNLADVERPEESLIGLADSATEGAVTAAQLETRPVLRAGDVLETVPGIVISQHSGEGKANQYYLRGFNLDHGTDLATTVAGLPVNMPTHAHGQGYSDNAFLIPELVSGIQYKKGPYFAEEGDFSAAGAVNVNYVSILERGIVRATGGEQGYRRLLVADTPPFGGGHVLYGLELIRNDGPWARPDEYRKVNGILRYSRGDSVNGFSISAMGYEGEWNATDQVPRRAFSSGLISRFDSLDPTDGGKTHRYSVSGEWQSSREGSLTRAALYGLDYSLNLFSNFTYFLNDPLHGDQFEQEDRRVVGGGKASHQWHGDFLGRGLENTIGLQVRHDRIRNVGLYQTAERLRLSTVRRDRVNQASASLYWQSSLQWSEKFRGIFGLRGDSYWFDVASDREENSGDERKSLASPKLSLVLGPWAKTEFYVNAGYGFHSNDARGATIRVDPATGQAVERVTPLVRAKGAEIGLRSVILPRWQTTLSFWGLDIDSELVFVGDAGTTEAGRPSRRSGVEWANYWKPVTWLTFDADLALSRARFRDFDPAGERIPGSVARVISAGISVDPLSGAFGSLRLRHIGPRPLIEDATVRSKSSTLLSAEVGYEILRGLRVALEAFNLLDANASDIDYFYESRLPGEPAAGITDIHTHPVEPRSVRLSVSKSF